MGESRTVLVTGANGLVGFRACEYLTHCTDWDIFGTSRKNGHFVSTCAELSDQDEVDTLASLVEPDVVIHTAAISRTDTCEQHHELCHAINVEATEHLIQAFPAAKFIYFSTYAVYDTPAGHCNETCDTRAINYYVQTKLDAEQHVQKLHDYVILRPSVMFGYVGHVQESSNYFMQLLDAIRKGSTLRSPTDQYFNPIWVDCVVEILRHIIINDVSGIFNVGSNEDISKYEFNRAIMERFGFDKNFLEGISSVDLRVKRPSMGTISSEKIQQRLGYSLPPLAEMIDDLYMQSVEDVRRYLSSPHE